jgi:transcription elongation factor GreB
VSRAFTKEDDAGAPPLVAHRAPLPPGTPNYVTRRGLLALREELGGLLRERARLEGGEPDSVRAFQGASLLQRIAELEARVASAELVEPPAENRAQIRFGAVVSFRTAAGTERSVRIVGVDEADAGTGRIAFVAPLARALLGKSAGDSALVRTPHGEDEIEILGVDYETA